MNSSFSTSTSSIELVSEIGHKEENECNDIISPLLASHDVKASSNKAFCFECSSDNVSSSELEEKLAINTENKEENICECIDSSRTESPVTACTDKMVSWFKFDLLEMNFINYEEFQF
jgi:hypothetical protein